jgi:YggT family protein
VKSILILFDSVVNLYIWVLIINAIISWLVAFNVLNTSNRFVYSVLEISYKLTEPLLSFIRKYIPSIGSIDISPIILILGLMFLRNLVFELFAPALF